MSSLATPLRHDYASNHYVHLGSVVGHQNQKGVHEEIAAAAECETVLNPSRRVKGALTKGRFAMGSAHGGSRPEEAEMAPEDTVVHPADDSNPYVRPTHDDPNQPLDHSWDHSRSVPGDKREANDECL